jgi:hypothetical protein
MTPSGPVTLTSAMPATSPTSRFAVIAHGLVSDGIAARYTGLMHHQERMLQYLGFEARV